MGRTVSSCWARRGLLVTGGVWGTGEFTLTSVLSSSPSGSLGSIPGVSDMRIGGGAATSNERILSLEEVECFCYLLTL